MIGHGKVVEIILNAFGLVFNKLIMTSVFRRQILDIALICLVIIIPRVGIIEHDGGSTPAGDVEAKFAEIGFEFIHVFKLVVVLVVVIVETFGLV